MHAAMPFVCILLPLSVCMGVAESAAADWPQVCCVCHISSDTATRLVGWLVVLLDWWDGCVCASLVRTAGKSLALEC